MARWLAAVALAGAGGFALLLAVVLSSAGHGPTAADSAVAAWLEAWRGPALDRAMTAVTLFGDGLVVAAIAAVLAAGLVIWGHRRAALYLVATLAAVAFSEDLAKLLVARPRPTAGLYEGWDALAFPSGHAAKSGALAGAILVLTAFSTAGTRLRRRALYGSLVPVLLIALSRVWLGAHWASDVAGGLALAAAWVGALGLPYRRAATLAVPAVRLLALAAAARTKQEIVHACESIGEVAFSADRIRSRSAGDHFLNRVGVSRASRGEHAR